MQSPTLQTPYISIPLMGIGTWKSDPGQVKDAVEIAVLRHDYHHIDCAKAYRNEDEVGAAIQSVQNRGVGRSELFITSKLWNTDHAPSDVLRACKQSLHDLQLDYLDLYLMHWAVAFEPSDDFYPGEHGAVALGDTPLHETWAAMEALVDQGLVRHIGVANFSGPLIQDLLQYARIRPAVNQIEIHPYLPQYELVEFCQRHDVVVTAYSPLGSHGAIEDRPLSDPTIEAIADRYQRTPAQIALRWLVQRNIVVIPKSISSDHIAENRAIFDFELTEQDMSQIAQIGHRVRFVNPSEPWGIPYFS